MKTFIILMTISACSAQNYTIRKFDRRYDISDGFGWLSGIFLGGNDYHENVRTQYVEKKMPVPYTVEKGVPYIVEKEVPVNVEVPDPQPYIVEEVPYPVKEYIKVPYAVKKPYQVIKKVPYKVEVPVHRPYKLRVNVPRPYVVEKRVPVPVKVLVRQPHTLEKKIPYPVRVKVPVPKPFVVEKQVPVEVQVPVERPYVVPVPRPYPVTVEKHVPIAVEKPVPVEISVHKHEEATYNNDFNPTYEGVHAHTNTEYNSLPSTTPVLSDTKFNHNANVVKFSQPIAGDWTPIGEKLPSQSQPQIVKPIHQSVESHYSSQSINQPEHNQNDELYFQNNGNTYSNEYADNEQIEYYNKHAANEDYKHPEYESITHSDFNTGINNNYHKGVVESVPGEQFVQSSYSIGADDSVPIQHSSNDGWPHHSTKFPNKQHKYSQEIKEYVIRDDRALENYPSEYVVKASEQENLYNQEHNSIPSDSHIFKHPEFTESTSKGFGEFKSSPQITQSSDQWVGVPEQSVYGQHSAEENIATFDYNQPNVQSEHVFSTDGIKNNPRFEALVQPNLNKASKNVGRQPKEYSVSEVNFENPQHGSNNLPQYGYEPPSTPHTGTDNTKLNEFNAPKSTLPISQFSPARQSTTKSVVTSKHNQLQAVNRYLPEAAKQMYAFQQVAQSDLKTNQHGYSQYISHDYKAPQNSHQQPYTAESMSKPNYAEVNTTQNSEWKPSSDDWKPIDTKTDA